MVVSKQRAPIPFGQIKHLLASGDVRQYVVQNGSSDAVESAERFLYHVYRYALRPVVLVSYEREAFYQKFDRSVRITLDKNLRSLAYPDLEDLFGEEKSLASLPRHFVLEIKSHKGVPMLLKTALKNFRIQRTSVSKYAIALDTQRIPEGRSNVFSFSNNLQSGNGRVSGLSDSLPSDRAKHNRSSVTRD